MSKDIGCSIKHRDYDESKTLMNYFRENVDKKEGIYTNLVGKSCNSKLSKAVSITIEEISKIGKIKDEAAILQSFSVIYSECLRRLEENKEYLVRETVNENEVKKVIGKILVFYNYTLKGIIKSMNPQKKIDQMLSKGRFLGPIGRTIKYVNIQNIKKEAPHFNILLEKFVNSSPDGNDLELLAQTIYFNKVYSKDQIECVLCSKDRHFVAIESNGKVQDVVPSNIYSEFKVRCLSPQNALKKLKPKS